MKPSRIACILVGIAAMAGPATAEVGDQNAMPFLGVVLDARPLYDLVTKHLNLSPGKGRRIENIWSHSPADQAGLERDDILVAFQGQDVSDMREFGDAVLKTGIGKLAFLDVIHSGQRKTVRITLVARPRNLRQKYPPDPDAMGGIWMGSIFRRDPQSGRWIPQDVNGLTPPPFPKEVFTAEYGQGIDRVSVIIEGNPRRDESTVIVKAGRTEHKTTLAQLDKLPAAYRDQVNQALHQARRDSDRRRAMWPGRRGPEGRGGGREGGPGGRAYTDARDRPPWADYTERMLGSLTRYLEGIDQSMGEPDMDRLRLLEERLRQLQAKIDEFQKQAKVQDPNARPGEATRP